MRKMDVKAWAHGLGWFSIGLGLGELLAPAFIKKHLGTPGTPNLVRGFGLREIGSGLLILFSRNPVTMVWGRVVGDVVDLATLAPALRDRRHRDAAGAAFLFVTLVTAVDVFVAMRRDE